MSLQLNSVYLSYSRNDVRRLPLAIMCGLRQHGYNVFMDTNHFRLSDAPPQKILNEIESHHYFMLVLTPASWRNAFNIAENRLKSEIQHAIQTERAIVVVFAYDLHIEPVRSHWLMKSVLPDKFIAILMNDTNVEALVDDFNKVVQQSVYRFASHSQSPEVADGTPSTVQLQAEFLLDQGLTEQYDAELYNRRSDAVSFYNKALDLDPEYAEAYFQRATYYYWTAFTKWQELTPLEVLASYDRAIQLSPEEARYYEKRAFLYERIGNKLSALSDFTNAIQYAPEESTYYRNRASLHTRLSNLDAALTDYDMAIHIKPDNGRYYTSRSAVYRQMGHYDLALDDVNRAIELDPRDDYYLWRGYIHADMQEHEKMEADFNEALAVSKDLAQTYARQASFYNGRCEYDKALKSVSEALKIDPNNRLAVRVHDNLLKPNGDT